MITVNKVAVIGAGGGGSSLITALAPAYDVTIIDGDTYEEHNSARQPFTRVGMNKAEAIAEAFKDVPTNVTAVPHMANGGEDLSDCDVIFCAVDSNSGRQAAHTIAKYNEKPLIVIANEEWEGMAWLWMPSFEFTNLNPFIRHKLGELEDGIQETCTGIQHIKEIPQTPAANHTSAGNGLTILHSLMTTNAEENLCVEIAHIPYPMWKLAKEIEQ